jgi:hypothetical protein
VTGGTITHATEGKCVTGDGTYVPQTDGGARIHVRSQDRYGRQVRFRILGAIAGRVAASTYQTTCGRAVTLRNFPPIMSGPMLMDFARKTELVIDSRSLNLRDYTYSYREDGKTIGMKVTLRARGRLFAEVGG